MRMDEYSTEPFEPETDAAYDWEYEGQPQPRIMWGRVAALGGAILVAFLLGRAAAPEGIAPRTHKQVRDRLAETQTQLTAEQDKVATRDRRIANLRNQVAELKTAAETVPEETGGEEEASPGDTYRVKEGDSLSALAQDRYGDAELRTCIAEANNMESNDQLNVGDIIILPPKEDCV